MKEKEWEDEFQTIIEQLCSGDLDRVLCGFSLFRSAFAATIKDPCGIQDWTNCCEHVAKRNGVEPFISLLLDLVPEYLNFPPPSKMNKDQKTKYLVLLHCLFCLRALTLTESASSEIVAETCLEQVVSVLFKATEEVESLSLTGEVVLLEPSPSPSSSSSPSPSPTPTHTICEPTPTPCISTDVDACDSPCPVPAVATYEPPIAPADPPRTPMNACEAVSPSPANLCEPPVPVTPPIRPQLHPQLSILSSPAPSEPREHTIVRPAISFIGQICYISPFWCRKAMSVGALPCLVRAARNGHWRAVRAVAFTLASFALCGDQDVHRALASSGALDCLFLLAFPQQEPVARHYACLALAALATNSELQDRIEEDSMKLIPLWVRTMTPGEFARHFFSMPSHVLASATPLLASPLTSVQLLASFHFAVQSVHISQANAEALFTSDDNDAPRLLLSLSGSSNPEIRQLCTFALRRLGIPVSSDRNPQQYGSWACEDVSGWIVRIGFAQYRQAMETSCVDGSLLSTLTDQDLKEEIGIKNAIHRRKILMEIDKLVVLSHKTPDDSLASWLREEHLSQYTAAFIRSRVDWQLLSQASDPMLQEALGITNAFHRMRILREATRRQSDLPPPHTPTASGTGSTETSVSLTLPIPQQQQQPPRSKYDIFISYRRVGGSQLASLMKVLLTLRGYRVFLDVNELNTGKFNLALQEVVLNTPNFILVLSEGCLDRCIADHKRGKNEDWVRREISIAIQANRNIIPVSDRAFMMPRPEVLPPDIHDLPLFNCVEFSHIYQEATLDKLVSFLKTQEQVEATAAARNGNEPVESVEN
eukprot:gnl/Trimastix_PCT/2621.p1 GENE.gnl/Trimastix_PCT/2621~~gnl/Trimastix_PCT/2621.p1  ORF type:complete len:821 (-),score=149.92 gnl/Trimastix_PCT/2621:151-2613(-)